MSNLTNALRIGTSGMQMSQLSLATVSHNVVNANTVGYSRQVVQSSANTVDGFGNGVKLENIQRIADRFITERLYNATSDVNYSNGKNTYLNTIESLFSSSGSGIDETVSGFMDSLAKLSNDPSNTALRRNAVQQADLLAQTVRTTYTSVQNTGTTIDKDIDSEIENVNQIIRDIASLNTQIAALTTGSGTGSNANDLTDMRDQKVSELSKYFGVQIGFNADNGTIRVNTENGRKLVDGGSFGQLTRYAASPYNGIGVQAVRVDGSIAPTIFPIESSTLTTGKFKAMIDVRDDIIPDLLAELNQFATTFKTAINTVASQGSSFPAPNSISSFNTLDIPSVATDLYTSLNPSLASDIFHISVVDSQGDPVNTTVNLGAITLPAAGPFSLTDLAALINANVNISNASLGGTAGVIASATTNSNGDPILTIQAANSNHRVVLSNSGGDVLGILGMNNLFSGSSALDLSVRSDILANPDSIPVARMRSTDGGLSSQDNQNIIALAAMADTHISFAAAGSLGSQSVTAAGYTGQILSNLAVTVANAKERVTFNENIQTQLQQLNSSVSGVNLNEELSEMMVYQNSFQASSRIIKVTSDLLQELMNII